jgi:hypothetical protein
MTRATFAREGRIRTRSLIRSPERPAEYVAIATSVSMTDTVRDRGFAEVTGV